MLIPKRVKHRKAIPRPYEGRAMRGNTVSHGEFGLVACEPSWITNRQIEAARIAMTRYIKRGGKVWIKIFLTNQSQLNQLVLVWVPVKVLPEYWVAVVKPGRVMFEMDGVPEATAREAMRLANHKLPIKCKFVVKGKELGGDVNEG